MNNDDSMLKAITNMLPENKRIIVEFENGNVILECEIFTMYETNNGFDSDDENFKEYYAACVIIKKVIDNKTKYGYAIDSYLEISIENEPTSIKDIDGNTIWSKNNQLHK